MRVVPWSCKCALSVSHPCEPISISVNRDTTMTPFLREAEPGYHRFQKIMPVLMHLKQKFLAAYNPHQQNAIDEAMIPFKGTEHLCKIGV